MCTWVCHVCIFKLLYLQHSKKYHNVNKADQPPHIYAIADQSYHMMMHNKHSQVSSWDNGAFVFVKYFNL